MPIAHNPDTGETLFLDGDQWKPAQQAINPKTREMMAFDGKDWVHVDNAAAKSVAAAMQKPREDSVENVPGVGPVPNQASAVSSMAGIARGAISTATGAAEALGNPDPRAKIDFIKNLAVGTVDALKNRYGQGLTKALESDPAGVLFDALSVAGGLRGGILGSVRGGVRGEAVTAPRASLTPAAEQATSKLNKASAADRAAGTDENTLAQVERLATSSAAAPQIRQVLTKQQEGSLDRIASGLKQLTGAKGNARQLLDETIAKQKAAGSPLYERAYAAGDREIKIDPQLSQSPSVRSAMQTAVAEWRDDAVANGYGSMSPTKTNIGGIQVEGFGNILPNIQFWDYVKGALDKAVDGQKNPDGSLTRRGRTLNSLKNNLLAQLDPQVPEYAAARKAWAGPASYVDAMDIGDNIFSASADNFIADVRGAPVANKSAIIEQAVSKIISTLGSNPNARGLADLTGKLKSPEMRQKITALMDDPATKSAWLKLLDREVSSSRFVGAGMKGSPTARRLALAANDAEIVDDAVLGLARATVTKGASIPGDVLKAALTKYKDIRAALTAERDAEMVKILSGKRPSTKVIPGQRIGRTPLASPFATPFAADVGGSQQ